MGNPPPSPLALVRMSGPRPSACTRRARQLRPILLWTRRGSGARRAAVHSRRAACRNSACGRHPAFALHRLQDDRADPPPLTANCQRVPDVVVPGCAWMPADWDLPDAYLAARRPSP